MITGSLRGISVNTERACVSLGIRKMSQKQVALHELVYMQEDHRRAHQEVCQLQGQLRVCRAAVRALEKQVILPGKTNFEFLSMPKAILA